MAAIVVIVAVGAAIQGVTLLSALVGLGGMALMCAAYVAFARPGLTPEGGPVAYTPYVVVSVVGLAVTVAVTPIAIACQMVLVPLVWHLASSRRPPIFASMAIGVAVLCGFVIWGEVKPGAFLLGATIAASSAAMAIALGLWISNMTDQAEERGRLIAQLDAAQSDLEALGRERGASAERERLAREIHDTLAQTLAGLVMLTERAGRQSREGAVESAIATIENIENLARDALAESRVLVTASSAVHSEGAFDSAIAHLVERFRVEARMSIEVELPSMAITNREAQVILLRCLQEALSNVRRHAHAQRVQVVVHADEHEVTLQVSDDGQGFTPDESRFGFGLDGMNDRVMLAGGTMKITSSVGSGTRLYVRLPLAQSRVVEGVRP